MTLSRVSNSQGFTAPAAFCRVRGHLSRFGATAVIPARSLVDMRRRRGTATHVNAATGSSGSLQYSDFPGPLSTDTKNMTKMSSPSSNAPQHVSG